MNTNETNILNLQNISITLGARKVLDDVSFGMSAHDKIGVIGVNGTGKSTLLGIAAGMLEPDEGEVIRGRTVQISCLTQNPRFDGGTSVLVNIAARVRGKADHWDTEGEVRAMLQKFGIDDPDVSPDTLSGGQKKRAALVAAILTPADLLILDEPTNHLDAEMIEWLEEFLISFRGAILMVTHDRYFLDEVTDQILEIDRGKIWRYDANYAGPPSRRRTFSALRRSGTGTKSSRTARWSSVRCPRASAARPWRSIIWEKGMAAGCCSGISATFSREPTASGSSGRTAAASPRSSKSSAVL